MSLDTLYLQPSQSGVSWLLDPQSPTLAGLVRVARERTAATPCNASALAGDLEDLQALLQQRHFGLATGIVDAPSLPTRIETWRQRLHAERPSRWGAALGADIYGLRRLLRDNHLRAAGEDREILAAADVRAAEVAHGREDGPLISTTEQSGVLCIRIRQFGGTSRAAEECMLAWQNDHARHFGYDRIVVDVRSNPGGADSYTLRWIAEHARNPVHYPPGNMWTVDGKRLSLWNSAAVQEAVGGSDSLSDSLREGRPDPRPSSNLSVQTDEDAVPAGPNPWPGRMIVLLDRLSASAAESTAWILQTAFGARLAGGRSGGFLAYGDLAPYFLPRSGLMINIGTHYLGWSDVEMVGHSVDVALDPRTPLDAVAADFDRIYAG